MTRISRRPGSADGGAVMKRTYIPEVGPFTEETRLSALRIVAQQSVDTEEALVFAEMLGLIEVKDGTESPD